MVSVARINSSIKLTKFSIFLQAEPQSEIFKKISSGDWIKILESDEFKSFSATGREQFDKDTKLGLAIACLMAFIQDNFTGPNLYESSTDSIQLQTFDDKNERWKVERISVDGIEINTNINNLTLLIISRNFLEDLAEQFPSDLVS